MNKTKTAGAVISILIVIAIVYLIVHYQPNKTTTIPTTTTPVNVSNITSHTIHITGIFLMSSIKAHQQSPTTSSNVITANSISVAKLPPPPSGTNPANILTTTTLQYISSPSFVNATFNLSEGSKFNYSVSLFQRNATLYSVNTITKGFTVIGVNPSLPISFNSSRAILVTIELTTPNAPFSGNLTILLNYS